MPVKVLPGDWNSNVAYAVDSVVQYNGIRFRCIVAVPQNDNGNTDPITDISDSSSPSWIFTGVLRITDYYSLQYSIIEALNTDDEVIADSLPGFIQQAERLVGKLLRSPAQKVQRVFTVDSDSKFRIPGDMLEVIHLRQNGDDAGYNLRSRGSIVIERQADRTSFEELRQRYTNSGLYYNDGGQYEYPIWYSDNQFIWIAPDYDEGTEFQLQYYQAVPDLGTVRLRVNNRYEAINDQGMTLAEWIAAGNPADTFVQAQTTITANLWTQTQPHLIKSGACVEACRFLKDYERAQVWNEQFSAQLLAAQSEFQEFNTSGAISLQQQSAY